MYDISDVTMPYECEGKTNMNLAGDRAFWDALTDLVRTNRLVIDRAKGSAHPRYPDFTYPVDYGYLENTAAMDGGGIDVWKGSSGDEITGIFCTVDSLKKDAEIKIVIGCWETEIDVIGKVLNGKYMRAIFIRNPKTG